MKIRTDFVTNSSSTGFVAISVRLKDRSEISIERQYDTGYGGYLIWDQEIERAFDNAESVAQVYETLSKTVSYFDQFIIGNDTDGKKFKNDILAIKSINKILSIHVSEENSPDMGGARTFDEKKFEFVDVPKPTGSIFDDITVLTPSFDNTFGTTGEFANIATFDTYYVIDVVKHLMEDKGYTRKTNLEDRWQYADNPFDFKFLIIGDKTATEIDKGVYPDNYKEILKLKQKYGYIVLRESEAWNLDKYSIPPYTGKNFSIAGKRIFVCGTVDEANAVVDRAFEKGALVTTSTPDWNYSKFDYIVVSRNRIDGLDFKEAVKFKKNHSTNFEFISFEEFMEKTEALPTIDRSVPKEAICFAGKTFAVLGGASKAKKIIVDAGGTVLSAGKVKQADYAIYGSINKAVRDADAARIAGKPITLVHIDSFLSYFAPTSKKKQ